MRVGITLLLAFTLAQAKHHGHDSLRRKHHHKRDHHNERDHHKGGEDHKTHKVDQKSPTTEAGSRTESARLPEHLRSVLREVGIIPESTEPDTMNIELTDKVIDKLRGLDVESTDNEVSNTTTLDSEVPMEEFDVTNVPKSKAQRAFTFFYVKHRGFLLMKAYKPVKGEHYQLPGGRIDRADFVTANITLSRKRLAYDELIVVGRTAAAREILEETAVDLGNMLERLQFLPGVTNEVVHARRRAGKNDVGYVRGTKIPRKLYYLLVLDEDEFVPSKIQLSSEHIGYVLEPDVRVAAQVAEQHSGGDSGRALLALEKEMRLLMVAE